MTKTAELCLRLFFPLMALVALILCVLVSPYISVILVGTLWLAMGKIG